MVYFLKFGASWVLPPGIFILALFGVSIYLWRKRYERKAAVLLFVFTFLFYLLCTTFVSEKLLGSLEEMYQPPVNPTGDVVIMLGGGAMSDSPDISGEGALCASPANRLLTAYRLAKELDVPILLSGGQVYEDTGAEAKIARRILMDLGMPENRIFAETKSINTSQNARFSAEILREKGLTHPLLVTSAFHMHRAVLNFKKQGIDVTPYPADYFVPHHPVFHYTKLRPQADALVGNVTMLQERLRTLVTRYLE